MHRTDNCHRRSSTNRNLFRILVESQRNDYAVNRTFRRQRVCQNEGEEKKSISQSIVSEVYTTWQREERPEADGGRAALERRLAGWGRFYARTFPAWSRSARRCRFVCVIWLDVGSAESQLCPDGRPIGGPRARSSGRQNVHRVAPVACCTQRSRAKPSTTDRRESPAIREHISTILVAGTVTEPRSADRAASAIPGTPIYRENSEISRKI